VELSAVCFRWTNADVDTLNDRNEAILRDVNQAGRVWLSNASVRGNVGLRACITNHRTTEQDAHGIVEEVLAAADRVAARP
jgi:aromatic-L-amino-acid/L-tryptophan decarboxylase